MDVALTGDPNFANNSLNTITVTTTLDVTAPPTPTVNDTGFGQFKGSVIDAVSSQALSLGKVGLTLEGKPHGITHNYLRRCAGLRGREQNRQLAGGRPRWF
ncbi:hypothetical protein CCP4SC76_210005 [Gammaproteobacteria bacterium]